MRGNNREGIDHTDVCCGADACDAIRSGDVVTVQRSLGLSKATTIFNTDAHLWPTAEDRTRKAAESIMSVSLGEPAGRLTENETSTGE